MTVRDLQDYYLEYLGRYLVSAVLAVTGRDWPRVKLDTLDAQSPSQSGEA